MVTGTGSMLAKALLAILLLVVFAGCGDVPIDGATAVRDTLSQPNPDPSDTVPDPDPDPDPDPTPLPSSVRLTYLIRDPANPGGQRRETLTFPITAEVEFDTVPDGPRRIEVARISLNCPMPERVRESSVAERTGVPIRLRNLEIFIPRVRTPDNGGQPLPPVAVNSPSDDRDKASAEITISFSPTDRTTVETGRNGSDGWFRIQRIDRTRKILIAQSELGFKIREFGDQQEIPLGMEFTIGY